MSRITWSLILGLILVSISFLFYFFHYLVFGDFQSILNKGLASLAFVPIQGLVMTLIIAELLIVMGRRARLQKMNMVIGVFFSELGTNLLRHFYMSDSHGATIRESIEVAGDLNARRVQSILKQLDDYTFSSDMDSDDTERLKTLLVEKREFLVRLLENPNLLENERFTELLWAVFHLTEELDARENISMLTRTDTNHLMGDVARAYTCLFREWLHYMRHLHDHYPYLFSFAMRTNPLEPEAHVEVA